MPARKQTRLQAILSDILNGEADGSFDQLTDAIKARQRYLDAQKLKSLKREDHVVFTEMARPLYLIGHKGVIKGFAGKKAIVDLEDGPVGIFNTGMRAPIGIIEKV